MGTDAFNGSGSRFNSRFVQGEETYAKQLNDLAAGVQASLPTPYLGGGTVVSYIPGGSIITSLGDAIQQYQKPSGGSTVIPNPENPSADVQIAKLTVITQDVREETFGDTTTVEFALFGIWAYPTGSKTTGTNPTSPYMDSGGSIKIKNAAAGGFDTWGVYIVRQPFNKAGQMHAPQMVVMSDFYASPSDAYEKTTPWGEGSTTDSIRLYSVANATAVTVDGTSAGNFVDSIAPNPRQYNYNCQRVKVASMVWADGSWKTTQHLSGSITLPNTIQFYGTVVSIAGGTDPTTFWPNYSDKSDDWNGSWTGYSKSSSPTASVIVPSGFPV
jgi:hypothetical protein